MLEPERSPDRDAIAEKHEGTLRRAQLRRMSFSGEGRLRRAFTELIADRHGERSHPGMGNSILEPDPEIGKSAGELRRSDRVGGILRYQHRAAA